MLLDLSGVLSEQHTDIEQEVELDIEEFGTGYGKFPLTAKTPFLIKVLHAE